MTKRSEQINVPITPSTKDRWTEYVDENHEYEYITELIRGAVEREITGGFGSDDGGSGGLSAQSDERLSDIEGALVRIDESMKSVNTRMDSIEKSMQEPSSDMVELSGEVFDVLPREHEIEDVAYHALEEEFQEKAIVERGGGVEYIQTGRIEDIGEYLNEDSYRVRQAIEQLQDDTGLVGSVVKNGDKRYYRQ